MNYMPTIVYMYVRCIYYFYLLKILTIRSGQVEISQVAGTINSFSVETVFVRF